MALGAVIAQGILGGLTVLFFLPDAISTAHAGLAEIFFCMTVAIALFTSPGWNRASDAPVDDGLLRGLATTTTVLIYTQILVGATMRHTGAGLAIPDFPLMFGHLVPDHWDPKIAVHFAHRAGALVVTSSCSARRRSCGRGTAIGASSSGQRRCSRAGRDAGDARCAHRPEPLDVDQQRTSFAARSC
jgi:heme A synthase